MGIIIDNISTSFFSLARYSGGARINGEIYTYVAERDILVQDDWMKFYNAMPWDEFLAAVKTGVKPKLKRKVKASPAKVNKDAPSLFD